MRSAEVNLRVVTRGKSISVLVLLILVALTGSPVLTARAEVERRIVPVTINKGQNYTISALQEGASSAIKVVNNPNALVMQKAPGRIELVGAAVGLWNINVTLATGEKVTYVVNVKSETPPQGSLVPATAPTAIP